MVAVLAGLIAVVRSEQVCELGIEPVSIARGHGAPPAGSRSSGGRPSGGSDSSESGPARELELRTRREPRRSRGRTITAERRGVMAAAGALRASAARRA